MRQRFNPQLSLFTPPSSKPIAKELKQISNVLDETPRLVEIVYEDFTRGARADTGREGMRAEQELRCAILKQYRQLSYEEYPTISWCLPGSTFHGYKKIQSDVNRYNQG